MGWQDRDYSLRSLRERAEALGIRKPPAATLALLVLHGVAFVVMSLSASGSLANLPDFASLASPARQPLGILLHPLATTSFLDLLFVELALWSLGARIEALVGATAALGVYLGANLITGGVYAGIVALNAAIAAHAPAYPVGALAAWCAIVARRSRWETADFFGRPVRVGTLYGVCAAIVAVLTLLARGRGATAWLIAALAGGAAGCLFDLAQPWIAAHLAVPRERVPRHIPPRAARGPRPAAKADDADIDAILAKISRAGIGSLTDDERARLEAARQAKLRRERGRGT
jgi:membrane associated rhomboid family serine protease